MMQLGKKESPIDQHFEDMPDQELFLQIRDDLLYSRTGIKLNERISGSEDKKLISEVNSYISRIYRISEGKMKRFDAYIEQYVYAFHVLTEVMEAKNISDIKVLAWDNIRVKDNGIRRETNLSFWSKEDFRGFVEMLAVKNGINLGNVNAIQTFTDKKSSEHFIYRFDISTGVINSTEEPYLHIRKIPKEKPSVLQLIEQEMLTWKIADYLKHRRQEGYLIICGKNGSGKTYLLNALLDETKVEESVLVVQENEELFSNKHPDMMFQHIVTRKGDKKVSYGLKELVVNGLLTDIDHLVIGEIKGEEALYFITATLTGCLGMTTIHSVNAAGALDKMADYCKWESDYSREEIYKLLSGVKTIVYMKDFKVQEIVENYGWDEKHKYNQLEIVYDRAKGVDKL